MFTRLLGFILSIYLVSATYCSAAPTGTVYYNGVSNLPQIGVAPISVGGTGLSSTGAVGNVLTSTGSEWASTTPPAGVSINLNNSSLTSSGLATIPSTQQPIISFNGIPQLLPPTSNYVLGTLFATGVSVSGTTSATSTPDGNLWLAGTTGDGTGHLYQINPVTLSSSAYTIPTAYYIYSLVYAKGSLYSVHTNAFYSSYYLDTISLSGSVTSSSITGLTAGARLAQMTTDQSGDNIWAFDGDNGYITEISISGSSATTVGSHIASAAVYCLVNAPDGTIWALTTSSGSLYIINPTANTVSSVTLSALSSSITNCVFGADGYAYLSDQSQIYKVALTAPTSAISTYAFGTTVQIASGVTGADGNIYLGDSNNDALWQLNLQTGTVTNINSGTIVYTPGKLVAASDGSIFVIANYGENNHDTIYKLPLVNSSLYTNSISNGNGGSITTVTPSTADNSTNIATTAYVQSQFPLPISNGGTGAATFTAHGVMLGEGASALGVTAAGAANTALCGVASGDPTFQQLSYAQPQARAYLVSGSPYADGSGSGNSTIYYGPLLTGKFVTVDDGSGNLSVLALTELSLSLGSDTDTYPYSLYLVNTSGTLSLERDAWTGANTPPTYGSDALGRATAPGATNKLLVAEYALSANGVVNNWTGDRSLVNIYNLIDVPLVANIPTTSWPYSTATTRASNDNTTAGQGRVNVFGGSVPTSLSLTFTQPLSVDNAVTGAYVVIGLGLNSTDRMASPGAYASSGNFEGVTLTTTWSGTLSAGPNFVQMLENVETSYACTFYGVDGVVTNGLNGLCRR